MIACGRQFWLVNFTCAMMNPAIETAIPSIWQGRSLKASHRGLQPVPADLACLVELEPECGRTLRPQRFEVPSGPSAVIEHAEHRRWATPARKRHHMRDPPCMCAGICAPQPHAP